MTKQEILTKAIEKAIAAGYIPVTGADQDDLSVEWLAREYADQILNELNAKDKS